MTLNAVHHDLEGSPIAALVQRLVDEGTLNRGQANALLAQAGQAAALMAAGRTDQANRVLNAFMEHVSALSASGVLVPEDAEALIGAARALVLPLKDLLPGTWYFEGAAFCFLWQDSDGSMTLEWIDREAGTFTGAMTYWRANPPGFDPPGVYLTQDVTNGFMADDGAIQFSAPFQAQFSLPPQSGTFDGTTIRTTWTANCGVASDFGGPVEHSVTYTR